ncbi:uncharacterized protein LOC135924460 [Gordionus sp. m RMFG-2023]|uniref:uncharacterized protein LOC135924460 n=1 Tax=Gordionus sp. m RMFG-2023 TaxID=3053472 RepID=UPI0031FCD679
MWTDLSFRSIDTAISTLGLTRGGNKSYKKLWWWNEELTRQITINPRISTKAVARAKAMAYDDMYEEVQEGQYKIYRLAKQREKNSRDINGAPKHMKNNKASGPDDIPIEILKELGDDCINLYNKILGN